MPKKRIWAKGVLFSFAFSFLLPPTLSWASEGGSAVLALFFVFFILPILSLIAWFVIHLWPERLTRRGIILSALFDGITIFYLSSFVPPSAWLTGNWYYRDRLFLLVILIILITYLSNRLLASFSRTARTSVLFFLCLSLTLLSAKIRDPHFSGPTARWFVNPEALFKGSGFTIVSPAAGKPRAEYYGFDQQLGEYYKFREGVKYSRPKLQGKEGIDKRPGPISPEKGHDISQYLILEDIGDYSWTGSQQKKGISGGPVRTYARLPEYILERSPGMLSEIEHFNLDHEDITFITKYETKGSIGKRSRGFLGIVNLQVTRHAGSDSDRWLRHEAEGRFKTEKYARQPIFGNMGGHNILVGAPEDREKIYCWVSDNFVVNLQFRHVNSPDLEPEEVLKAYLAKFPSTIPPVGPVHQHDKEWREREMERRLWLGDKWLAWSRAEGVDFHLKYEYVIHNLYTFIDYRDMDLAKGLPGYLRKAFGPDEKRVLWEYLRDRNSSAIEKQLDIYKAWRVAHK